MDENLELLEYIYKDSDMSVITLEKLLQELNDKDNKIKKKTEEILKSYEDFLSKSKKLLNKFDSPLEENSYIAKMGAKMGIKKEITSMYIHTHSRYPCRSVICESLSFFIFLFER